MYRLMYCHRCGMPRLDVGQTFCCVICERAHYRDLRNGINWKFVAQLRKMMHKLAAEELA